MNETANMTVTLRLPARMFHEGLAEKVTARAENGAFGVLPGHIDFVTALVPSVLTLTAPGGVEQFFGIDEGILVKHGRRVEVCVRRAAQGTDLESLKTTVRKTFLDLDEQERTARTALTRLEANMVRRFAELQDARP